jgi:hypothetical protein
METAVARLMRELLHDIVKESVHLIFQKSIPKNAVIFQEVLQVHICSALELYIEAKMDTQKFRGVVPRDSIGRSIVQLIRPLLQAHIKSVGFEFYNDVAFETQHEIMEESPDMDVRVEELYLRIGSFFGFRSPLLEDFWPEPEPEVEEHVP